MPKRIEYTLTETELLTIEQAIKNDPDLRLRQRAQIVRLLHKGYKPEAIADVLSISTGPVYYWHSRWRKEGLDGLRDKPRSGRPRIGDEAYRHKLEEVLATDPQRLGFAFTVWTPARLLAYMEQETGVAMHENTLRNLLDELDYVYRRPKHDMSHLQDKKAKAEAEETLEMLKKKPNKAKSNFSLWMKRP
jgi:putative transposase